MSEIKAFKLLNNMDVIARVKEETEDSYMVESPLLVIMQHGNTPGEVSIEFMPISPLADPEDTKISSLFKTSIITSYSPIPQIERMYMEQTSGFDLSPSQQQNVMKGRNHVHTIPISK